MKPSLNLRSANHMRLAVASVAAVGLLVALPGSAQAATTIPLGTADGFAVLAGQEISNIGLTTINGDVGLSPNGPGSITGFNTVTQAGTIHAADQVALDAQAALGTAYDNASGQPATSIPVELSSGVPLTAGVYSAGTFEITNTLTLDAQNDPNAVFIFTAASTLITASASRVELINGAQPCNVFWQVTSSATLGSGSSFTGTILALTTIELGTGATVEGRVLARNGRVSLLGNTITVPRCAAAPAPTSSPSPSPSNQVANVPVGSVSTGNGTSTGTSAAPYAVLGALVVAGIGSAAAVAVRRRRLNG